jgi:hypothetical protein
VAVVATLGTNHDDARRGIIPGNDDDDRGGGGGEGAVIVRTIPMIMGARVAVIMRAPNHDLPVKVGITEAECDADSRLRVRDARGDPHQQSQNNE